MPITYFEAFAWTYLLHDLSESAKCPCQKPARKPAPIAKPAGLKPPTPHPFPPYDSRLDDEARRQAASDLRLKARIAREVRAERWAREGYTFAK